VTTPSHGEGGIGSVLYQDSDFWCGALCYKMYTYDEVISRYLFHYLSDNSETIISCKNVGGQPYINRKQLEKISIPIPSLSEQQRIVEQLDTFTSSIENLKEQITLRRKQYEYYRDQLLDLEGKEGVKTKALETIAEIGTGSSNTQDELEIGKYPFFVRSQIVRWKNDYEYDETAIITSGDGVGVGKVLHYYEGKYALHQRAYRIHIVVEDFVPKFLYYYMQKDFYNYIMLNAYAASVTSVRKPMLLKYPIPVPSLSEQQRIVDILDKFEASIQNLEAQLSQREKQYEYYRNKLLTFEE
jgi:type I restriction enzyme S subunit